MATNISAEKMLSSYQLFNATGIKSFIIDQLQQSGNPIFQDADYLGSNMNMFVETLAVILQQIQFTFSVSTSETSWSNAQLFESMNKLSSILNYKVGGKQTSMLPVTITITKPETSAENPITQMTIPRFLTASYNYSYVLKDEVVIDVSDIAAGETVDISTVMFQGNVQESQVFTALGDEFETFVLRDSSSGVRNGGFISDNFFFVFVDESTDESNDWHLWEETLLIFQEDERGQKYERRFTEDMNYEFKFGNGVHGKRLKAGNRVVIFYLESNGSDGRVDDILVHKEVKAYGSSLYSTILSSMYANGNGDIDVNVTKYINHIRVSSSGQSSELSYPESVESIRAHAPRAFASQNRLFTLGDYRSFIQSKFSSYVRDLFVFDNDYYTNTYLRYYYTLGLTSPNKDSRVNLAQVQFMTACNFNNVYVVVLPKVNTVLYNRVPNYVNDAVKQEMVSLVEPYKGLTHNLVILDPHYRAYTFGSPALNSTDFNAAQLSTKLVLVRSKLSKYSVSSIKNQCIDIFTTYFNNLRLGDAVNVAELSARVNNIQGIDRFFIRDANGNEFTNLHFFSWNPLYSNEDNQTSTQTIGVNPFVFCYFYDLNNISNIIEVESAQ